MASCRVKLDIHAGSGACAVPIDPLSGSADIAPACVPLARAAERLLADAFPATGPGAVALIARGDEVLYRGARGMADVAQGLPLSTQHVFRLGSLSKQFVA